MTVIGPQSESIPTAPIMRDASTSTSSTSSPASRFKSPNRMSVSYTITASTQTPPDSAGCQTADTRHLHARPITPTAMKANGAEAGAYDGRSSFGRSGRKIRCCVPAAGALCESSHSSPMELLSTRYSGTSLSSMPTRRLRAIILRPSFAGRLSGEPAAPRIWPQCPTRAARSVPERGRRPSSCAHIFSQGRVISPQKPAVAR